MTIYLAIDRSPDAGARLGHPEIVAFTVAQARRNYVAADPAHRQAASRADADRLCRLWYGVKLDDALTRGVI
jgi:hypothetical protein